MYFASASVLPLDLDGRMCNANSKYIPIKTNTLSVKYIFLLYLKHVKFTNQQLQYTMKYKRNILFEKPNN